MEFLDQTVGTVGSPVSRRPIRCGLRRSAALLIVVAIAGGCATGIRHHVRPGENLFRIGKAYGIDYHRLARINRIPPPYRIRAGQSLFIPGATRQLPVTVITPRAASSKPPVHTPSSRVPVSAAFIWPVSGRISSKFGKRNPGHHDGVDIAARKGTSVRAARSGKVIFSDRLSGYGNVIIVEHDGGFTTVYAHNDKNLVHTGARVSRGQRIATVGQTGRATGPHLHFEIRKDNIARNPLYYLPSSPRTGSSR